MIRCSKCTTTVPVHAGEDIGPGLLRAIERQLEPCLGECWLKYPPLPAQLAKACHVTAANFIVRYERDETGWWVASIASVPGCLTQGRTIEQARERIREALAALTNDRVARAAKLVDDVVLPPAVKKAVKRAVIVRNEFEVLTQRLQKHVTEAAKSLEREGLSLRDVCDLLGVSRQRVHQILDAKKAERPARKAAHVRPRKSDHA